MVLCKIEPALPSDAAAIAAIGNDAEPDLFRQFMEGSTDAAKKEEGMLHWWTQYLESPVQLVLVARDEGTSKIVSYAQWELPKGKEDEPPAASKTEEERGELREKRKLHIRPGQNGPLLLEWWERLDVLQTTSFGNEPLYYLNDLRTIPEHRGQGLASKLIRQVLDEADKKGLRTGLYTDGDGQAKFLYEKFGYAEAGRFEINLTNFGGEGRHLELAMIRAPPRTNESLQLEAE